MQDLALRWDAELTLADWRLTGGGNFEMTSALETAVMVSLFTDARALPGDKLLPGETDPRGWWGDLVDDLPIGSRLWLLRRDKRLPETLKLARDYIAEALRWLVTDEIAAKVEVETAWASQERIGATIRIFQGDSGTSVLRAEWAWQGV